MDGLDASQPVSGGKGLMGHCGEVDSEEGWLPNLGVKLHEVFLGVKR